MWLSWWSDMNVKLLLNITITVITIRHYRTPLQVRGRSACVYTTLIPRQRPVTDSGSERLNFCAPLASLRTTCALWSPLQADCMMLCRCLHVARSCPEQQPCVRGCKRVCSHLVLSLLHCCRRRRHDHYYNTTATVVVVTYYYDYYHRRFRCGNFIHV